MLRVAVQLLPVRDRWPVPGNQKSSVWLGVEHGLRAIGSDGGRREQAVEKQECYAEAGPCGLSISKARGETPRRRRMSPTS